MYHKQATMMERDKIVNTKMYIYTARTMIVQCNPCRTVTWLQCRESSTPVLQEVLCDVALKLFLLRYDRS